MHALAFSVENGGPLEFADERGLMEIVQIQTGLWRQWIIDGNITEASLVSRKLRSNALNFIITPWTELLGTFHSRDGIVVVNDKIMKKESLPKPEPVLFTSALGGALREIAERYGVDLMKRAYQHFAQPNDPNLHSLFQAPREMRALIEFYNRLSVGLGEPLNSNSSTELLERVKSVADEWSALKEGWSAEWESSKKSLTDDRSRLSEHIGKLLAQLSVIDNVAKEKLAGFDVEREKFSGYSEGLFDAIKDKFDNLEASYDTQFKINSAVKLWKARTTEFANAAKKSMGWARGVAIGGVVGAILWVVASYHSAGWLFENAVDRPSYLENVSVKLNPVFHFQLIFTSVSTIFYVTLFLWVMRLMVKNYLANEHLRIDAMSRSSMAETYIALIKEGAATADGDRAIVLASLFRPVTDGLVKDDGPPAISLPAILASMAQGRN